MKKYAKNNQVLLNGSSITNELSNVKSEGIQSTNVKTLRIFAENWPTIIKSESLEFVNKNDNYEDVDISWLWSNNYNDKVDHVMVNKLVQIYKIKL